MASVTLPIVCAINNAYALPLLVMLTSLKAHLRATYRLQLYLIHRNISDSILDAISSIVDSFPIVPGAELLANIPRNPHFPPEASFPLLLPDLLPPKLDRVLFLDADLLVLDDVAQLWETPLGHHTAGATPDAAIPFCRSPRGVKNCDGWGIPAEAVYFNCGVMLIDLVEWRNRDVTRRVYGYLRSVGERVDFIHQEALNAVLWNDWMPIESRWNLLGSLAGRPYGTAQYGACENPGIVHFAGRFKPWRAPVGGPFNHRYATYLSQTEHLVPAIKPGIKDKFLSLYDRNLRNQLYACERALWNRGII